MTLVDVNVLLYVVNQSAPHHQRVQNWWEAAIRDERPLGLTWLVIVGFLRLATHPGIFDDPLSAQEAATKIETWLALPNIGLITEADAHWTLYQQLIRDVGAIGNLANDIHLAAIAIGSGASIVSCDSDFARFQHVRWENPLTDKH
ncbi:MAG TPA: type II toxin-antitoxin system VapC family toxin [Lacipirellulaceae bacterium]|nr:type II toxin-antitoxin system VapC family toxin [Lacipirellulaceae bacterium]